MNIKERKEQKAREDRQRTMKTLTFITQFGINMLVPIFLCFFGGMWLDKKFDTKYWIIIGFFVGAIAGFRNVYVLVRKSIKNDSKDLDTKEK